MITLTFDNRAPDPYVDPKYYTTTWNTFLKRLRRKYPKLKFARVVELTRTGRPHFHVLVDQYIPQRYVSWAFAECGGGKVADCRYVDPGRAGRYIAKYVTKSYNPESSSPYFFYITRMRTVSTSRNLYYVVQSFGANSMCIRDITDSCYDYLKRITRFHDKNLEYYFNDNGRDPPLLFFPRSPLSNANDIPYIEPLPSLLCIRISSLDLRSLPDPNQIYIHFSLTIPASCRADLEHGKIPETLLLTR